jgi:hypothetical protein
MAGRELRCANFEGECMERKRRRRGSLPTALRGGRGAIGGDQGGDSCGGAPTAVELWLGLLRVRVGGGEVVREEADSGTFYRAEEEGEAAR